jgi:surface protein
MFGVGIGIGIGRQRFGGGVIPFQFTIDTRNVSTGSSNANQFSLPLNSTSAPITPDFTIYWGDGTSDYVNSFTSPIHTYASGGVYTITIEGVISGIKFSNTNDRLKILNVNSWGALTNLGSASNVTSASNFFGCENLTTTATDSPILQRNLGQLFRSCTSLTSGLSNWNTSLVTSTNAMFRSSAFNGNIGSWDVSNVTDFINMFLSCGQFNNGGSDSIKNWDTSSAINMVQVFSNATSFNQPIEDWDVSSVTNMNGLFQNAQNFNQPLGGWDVSAVTNMSVMFNGATNFNQYIDAWDIRNVTNFTSFMASKTPSTLSANVLGQIYDKWSALSVNPNLNISFGTAKYDSTGVTGRGILTSSPNNWTITDGGLL